MKPSLYLGFGGGRGAATAGLNQGRGGVGVSGGAGRGPVLPGVTRSVPDHLALNLSRSNAT